MKRILLVAASIVALASLAFATLSVVSLMAHERTRQRLAFPPGITELRIHLDAGGVILIGSDTNTISGERVVDRGLRHPSYQEVRIDKDTLQLQSGCPDFMSLRCGVHYELTVPRGMRVVGTSSGGSIELEDLQGRVTLSSSGGGISANGTSGELWLSSSGGAIRVEDAAGQLQLDSSGGGITVVRSRASEVSASSSGGGVRLDFSQPPRLVDASSSGGGVRVSLPRIEAGYDVDADASGGDTEVDVELDTRSKYRIRASSSGGGVNVSYGAAPA